MRGIIAAVISLAVSVSVAAAQEKLDRPAPAGTVRVAVVNVGVVFHKYERAAAFKNELAGTMAPFKKKVQALNDQGKKWAHELKAPALTPAQKDKLEQAIRDTKRQLEDTEAGFKRVIGKKQEDSLITLWKDVRDAVKTCAKQQGIRLVIAYGDPIEKELLEQFPNINRKMQAIDMGSALPLFIDDGVDISEAVVVELNRRYREELKKTPKSTGVDF
jgi:Skp family chaperone for outer membrane proteins